MIGGAGDLRRSATYRPPKPERANSDKVQKPSDMACSRLPITKFSWIFSQFFISAWSAMMNIFEGDGADRAAVIGLVRQGFARVGLEADQPDRDRVNSDPDRPIGVRSVRSGTTEFSALVEGLERRVLIVELLCSAGRYCE